MIITARNMATIKRVAQSCAPYTVKKAKLQKKLVEIATEIQNLDAQQAGLQGAIADITGGRTTEQLLIRTVVNGAAKYEPNPDVLRWNETTRVWEDICEEKSVPEVIAESNQEENAFEAAMEQRAADNNIEENPFND